MNSQFFEDSADDGSTYSDHSGTSYSSDEEAHGGDRHAHSDSDDGSEEYGSPGEREVRMRGGMMLDAQGKRTPFQIHHSADDAGGNSTALMSEVPRQRGREIQKSIVVRPVLNLLQEASATLDDFGAAGECVRTIMERALAVARDSANGASLVYCAALPNFDMPHRIEGVWPSGVTLAYQMPVNRGVRSPIPWMCLPQKDMLRGVLAVRLPPPDECNSATEALYKACLGARTSLSELHNPTNSMPDFVASAMKNAALGFDWSFVALACEVVTGGRIVLWLVLRDGHEPLSTLLYQHLQSQHKLGWHILAGSDFHISGNFMQELRDGTAGDWPAPPFALHGVPEAERRALPLNIEVCRQLLRGKLVHQAQTIGALLQVPEDVFLDTGNLIFTMTHGFHTVMNEGTYIIYGFEADCVASCNAHVLAAPPHTTHLLHGADVPALAHDIAPYVRTPARTKHRDWTASKDPWLYMFPTSTMPLQGALPQPPPPPPFGMCYLYDRHEDRMRGMHPAAVPGACMPRSSPFRAMEKTVGRSHADSETTLHTLLHVCYSMKTPEDDADVDLEFFL